MAANQYEGGKGILGGFQVVPDETRDELMLHLQTISLLTIEDQYIVSGLLGANLFLLFGKISLCSKYQ